MKTCKECGGKGYIEGFLTNYPCETCSKQIQPLLSRDLSGKVAYFWYDRLCLVKDWDPSKMINEQTPVSVDVPKQYLHCQHQTMLYCTNYAACTGARFLQPEDVRGLLSETIASMV